MKTICITGGNGLLGSKLVMAAKDQYRIINIDLAASALCPVENLFYYQVDITDKEKITNLIDDIKPECVFHTAALTNVDACEREKNKAWDINVLGTENLIQACQSFPCKFIHLSTDYIFNGNNGPYSEDDLPSPISVYGKTKLESEKIVQNNFKDYIIARTMILYGYFPGVRKNFITWLIDQLQQRNTIQIVTDQYGTPTLADDCAEALLTLFKKNARGIYHTAGRDLINRYDMAKKLIDIFEFKNTFLSPITSDQLNQDAPRPLNSGLKTDKIKKEYGIYFSSIEEGIALVKEQIKNKSYTD
ncbi:MAG: dTDP-4-dehydrorhamnose reductase [bacterium]